MVEGSLGTESLTDLANGTPSDALTKRTIPTTTFRDGDDLVVVPEQRLQPGLHTVAIPSLAETWPFTVTKEGASVLEREWPPHGRTAASALAMYCGTVKLAPLDEPATLEPDGPEGRFVMGTPLGAARRCVRFAPKTESASAAGVLHAPPALGDAASRVYLDPSPIALSVGEPAPTDLVACEEGEVPFGPGCATVMDDRVRIRTPEAPVFWAVSAPGIDFARTTKDSETFTVRGLAPSTDSKLTVEIVGLEGAFSGYSRTVHTSAPTSHVVITEVYADAIGPEPASEWVEIQNDGLAPATLDGLILRDIGGDTALPAETLAPQQIALVVGDDFVGDGEYDVPPAPGTLLLRVPRVGKNGLGNQGEPLKLVDAAGTVVSAFPASPKPKSGQSVARVSLDAEDGDASSFRLSDPPTPGAPNGL